MEEIDRACEVRSNLFLFILFYFIFLAFKCTLKNEPVKYNHQSHVKQACDKNKNIR
jgi:hypothetical protein